jgi:hypothetical protein
MMNPKRTIYLLIYYSFIALVVALCLLLLAVAFYLHSTTYAAFVQTVLTVLHRPNWQANVERVFPIHKFKVLKTAVYVASVGVVLLGALGFRFRTNIKAAITATLTDVQQLFTAYRLTFAAVPRPLQLLFMGFLGVAFAQAAYYLVVLHISYDEAFSYNYFMRQGGILPLLYYPNSNNHVFFSAVAALFAYLPLPNVVWAIRLPSLLAFALLGVSFFRLAQGYVRREAAILATAVLLTAVPMLYYAGQARGYMFSMLAFLWLLQASLSVQQLRRHWLYISVLAALNMWIIPSVLYAMMALFVGLQLTATNNVVRRRLVLGFLVGGMLTVLLYTPILLTSDLQLAIFTPYVDYYTRPSWATFTRQIIDINGALFGRNTWLCVGNSAIIAIGLLLAFRNIAWRKWAIMSSFLFVAPLLVHYLQHTYTFGRSWLCFWLFFAMAWAFVCEILLQNHKKWAAYSLVTLFTVGSSVFAYPYITETEPNDMFAKRIFTLLQQQDLHTYYLAAAYYKPAIEYYANTQNYTLTATSAYARSLDYAPFDTTFQAVVWDEGDIAAPSALRQQYKMVDSLGNVGIWVQK